MPNLFAYGTLMCSDIMQHVTGLSRDAVNGELAGFARYRLRDQLYPAIVPDQQANVAGVIYQDLSVQAWARLDRFEGSIYQRQQVHVRLDDRTRINAETYVLRPAYRHLLLAEAWDIEHFIRHAKQDFMQDYLGYQRL